MEREGKERDRETDKVVQQQHGHIKYHSNLWVCSMKYCANLKIQMLTPLENVLFPQRSVCISIPRFDLILANELIRFYLCRSNLEQRKK